MSRIDDLIAEMCPNGVATKTLGDVGEFIRGNGLQKSDLTDEGTPAIHYGQIHTYYGVWAKSTKSFTDPSTASKLRRAKHGDVIIATTSEDDAAVAKATSWIGDGEVAVSGDAYIYRHSLDPRYVSYFLQSVHFQNQKIRHISGTKVRRISGTSLAKLWIPVPPLEVQREIVRVLDQFTQLEAELEAELEARRRQYAFYVNSLLVPQGNVESVPLGELAEFKYGYTAKAVDAGSYRFLRITDITPQGKLSQAGAKYVDTASPSSDYVVEPGDLLMARTGATYGKTMLVTAGAPAIYASFLIRIRFKRSNVLPSYYWHFAQSDLYWSQANALVSTGGQPQFNANVLKLVQIPVPPIEEQERVVGLLDKFDALVNDFSPALPAELAARRKQYEYYRDKLLTFEELPT
ncbi:restriction endonuclease subunit S [Janibacter sp. G1551]|uniref:restriction endonuclease subunit S n=1 Tax=Janibacter sp. G1551 TaxID=3420440 RepID=UPI003D09193A